MVRIGLLSDTHSFLDPLLLPVLEDCDEIWHAGDLGSLALLQQLRNLKKTLRVVYGNIDGHDIRIDVPQYLIWQVEKMKIFMTHIGGYPGHYTADDKQLQLLHINPGACGREGFQKVRTMIRFTIDQDKVKDLAIIEM